eukprot:scaffold5304_cov150-Skeletonema_marinoi.AAC.7
MIVFGPHIHHHNEHHAFGEDADVALLPDADTPLNRVYNSFRSSSNSGGGDEDTRHDNRQTLDAATMSITTRTPLVDTTCNNMLLKPRVEISKLLGSIGAPPLISSVDCCKNVGGANEKSRACHISDEVTKIKTAQQHTNEESVQTYLHSVVELAKSHTELLHTMQSCLRMLSVGTGVRLGIGPNNIPASRRAERAWLDRELRCHDTVEAAMVKSYKPKLTLHRCRKILHHAIVDQTTSLQNIVSRHRVNFHGITDWDDFAYDLKHTLESDCVLTLSRLTKWTDNVGEFLRALLSEFLSTSRLKLFLLEETHHVESVITTIACAVQMARERNLYLQSAFSMPSSSTTKSCEENLKRACGNEDGRDMNNLIDMLKSNLEGAQISLWAFEESRSRSEESETDWKNWLGELKDLVERSYSTMSELDNLVLPHTSDEGSKDMAGESLSDNIQDDHCITTPSAMLVSDGASMDEEGLHSQYETKQNVPLDKTLIFTGNGSHKRSHILKNETARSSGKSRNMPHPPSLFNQTVLLRDLQSRLKTMGLAEEYEVVAATESPDEESTNVGSRISQSRQRTDLPMFLGVSGHALAELSSAMEHQREEEVIME